MNITYIVIEVISSDEEQSAPARRPTKLKPMNMVANSREFHRLLTTHVPAHAIMRIFNILKKAKEDSILMHDPRTKHSLTKVIMENLLQEMPLDAKVLDAYGALVNLSSCSLGIFIMSANDLVTQWVRHQINFVVTA